MCIRDSTIRQTIAYHRELENIFGKGLVDPAIFFIGLQPHTLFSRRVCGCNPIKNMAGSTKPFPKIFSNSLW